MGPQLYAPCGHHYVRDRPVLSGGGDGQGRPFLYIDATQYAGTQITYSGTFQWVEETWALNPATGVAWTSSEINALQWGWEHQNIGGAIVLATELLVDYTQTNQLPTCDLTVDSVVGRTLTVTPTASDTDGTVTDLTIYWGNGEGTTSGCVSGQQYTHTYPPEGGTYGVYAEATDDQGAVGQSAVSTVVIDPNTPPQCSFTVTDDPANPRHKTINANASTDPDGTITAWRFLPGNGAGWIDGVVGEPLEYTYPSFGSYTCTVEVTDNEGATATQQASVDATAVPPTGDWTYSTIPSLRLLSVDATGIAPQDAQTITGYDWDWGDGGSHGAGVTNSHVYAAAGSYTVTLTVTMSSGSTHVFAKEISMATITKVSSQFAQRGAEITITGTGFGATQGTGTVTVGAKALTSVTWGDTSIVGTLASDTPYGAQDVVVTPDGGSATTSEKGVYCYDPTNNKLADSVMFGQVSEVFLDGEQVGFTSTGVTIAAATQTIEYTPDDRFEPVAQKTFTAAKSATIKFDQIDGELLATLLGGTYDSTSKTVTVACNAEYGEHSIAVKETDGRIWLLKRVKLSGDVTVTLNKEFGGIPTTWDVLGLNDPTQKAIEVVFP